MLLTLVYVAATQHGGLVARPLYVKMIYIQQKGYRLKYSKTEIPQWRRRLDSAGSPEDALLILQDNQIDSQTHHAEGARNATIDIHNMGKLSVRKLALLTPMVRTMGNYFHSSTL